MNYLVIILCFKVINKADQIVPYYVMDVLGDYPGLPGLFVAGILSGALRLIQLQSEI
jgi:sodium-coupled monocarboxylate transporter 8/12